MKGMVFTELFEFVEAMWSPEFLQEAIERSRIESRGIYTAAGSYPCCEMAALLSALSQACGDSPCEILRAYGRRLFPRFMERAPDLVEGCEDAFAVLARADDIHHREVCKLYPDAEFPQFVDCERDGDMFAFTYVSCRAMQDLCLGLIEGCLDHFGEAATIEMQVLAETPEARIRFTLRRSASAQHAA